MLTHQKLSNYILDKGITQAHIARKTGLGKPHLNAILKGKRPLSADRLSKICEVLGVTPDEIFYTKDEGGQA